MNILIVLNLFFIFLSHCFWSPGINAVNHRRPFGDVQCSVFLRIIVAEIKRMQKQRKTTKELETEKEKNITWPQRKTATILIVAVKTGE